MKTLLTTESIDQLNTTRAVIRVVYNYTIRRDGSRKHYFKHITRNVRRLELLKEQSGAPEFKPYAPPRWALDRTWCLWKGKAKIDGFDEIVYLWTFDDIKPLFGGCSIASAFAAPEDLSAWAWLHFSGMPETKKLSHPLWTDAAKWIIKKLNPPKFKKMLEKLYNDLH